MLLTNDIKNLFYFKKQVVKFINSRNEVLEKSKMQTFLNQMILLIIDVEEVMFSFVEKDYSNNKLKKHFNLKSAMVISLMLLILVIAAIYNILMAGFLMILLPVVMLIISLLSDFALKRNSLKKKYTKATAKAMCARGFNVKDTNFAQFMMDYNVPNHFVYMSNETIKEMLLAFIVWSEKNKKGIGKRDLLHINFNEFKNANKDNRSVLDASEMLIKINKDEYLILVNIGDNLRLQDMLREAVISVDLDCFNDNQRYNNSSVGYDREEKLIGKFSPLDHELLRVMKLVEREHLVLEKLKEEPKNKVRIKRKKI